MKNELPPAGLPGGPMIPERTGTGLMARVADWPSGSMTASGAAQSVPPGITKLNASGVIAEGVTGTPPTVAERPGVNPAPITVTLAPALATTGAVVESASVTT